MSNPKLLKGRASEIGAYYGVTTVVEARQPLFAHASSADLMMAELRHADTLGVAWTIAWVVMPDHMHWLFRLERGTLSACMQGFKSRSAKAVNRTVGRSGRLWQSGYHDHRLRNDDDLLGQARYIVANSLRKGLATRIQDYPFWWYRWISNTTDL